MANPLDAENGLKGKLNDNVVGWQDVLGALHNRNWPGKKHGSEWKGPCPLCKGDDRFWVGTKGAHCRQCGLGRKAFWKALLKELGLGRKAKHAPAVAPVVVPDKPRANADVVKRIWSCAQPVMRLPDGWPPLGGADIRYTDRDGYVVPFKTIGRWLAGELMPCKIERHHPKLGRRMLGSGPDTVFVAGELAGAQSVAVVEGARDALAVLDALEIPALATGGVGGWKRADVAEALCGLGCEVVLLPDADDAGAEAFDVLSEALLSRGCAVHKIGLEDGTDPADAWAAGILSNADWEVVRPASNKWNGEKGSFGAYRLALGYLGVAFRTNLRGHRREYCVGGGLWRDVTTGMLAKLMTDIADSCVDKDDKELRFTADQRTQYFLSAAAARRVDPFISWLQSLPAWDGEERLKWLLAVLFDVGGPLIEWASTYLCLAPVQRAYEPGCILREIPVLLGPQGCGKSALARCILPPGKDKRDKWFVDSFRLNQSAKELYESAGGAVIVEVAELAGMARAEIEHVKSVITGVSECFRPAYGRDSVTHKRRGVFVGTTNDPNPLPNDPSGNSRFVVAELRAPDDAVEVYLDKWRDKLWAEALHRYKAGERANFPRALMPEQDRLNLEFRSSDKVLEDVIEEIMTLSLRVELAKLTILVNDKTNGRKTGYYIARTARAMGYTVKKMRFDGKVRTGVAKE